MYWYILLVFTLFSGAEGLGCVLLATQPPQSHTSLASTGVRSSQWDVQTLQLSDGRRGSYVYEVNTWLWNFGRGKPRLGGLTVPSGKKLGGRTKQGVLR